MNENRFFRRIDWAAFWWATAISFLVYFFTLGPSVGLEDSGELATAADHLGVPHPPGYPFWSLCSWAFCRLFSWVTYMGQPTPAWAVSLFSAVAGAFAAGCTAMLICRSGSDMLDSMADDGADDPDRKNAHAKMGFAAGLGGSLVFAFSPVEWSQSTIVEIYSLNALFLMAVLLLSYRWMRKPSDKILWLTAFVFGLGLTNYQVLLFAALPLGIIIALKNIRMFRDTVMILVPIGLTAKVLSIGAKLRADPNMSMDVINKHLPILKTSSCPNGTLLALGCAAAVLAPLAALWMRRKGEAAARKTAIAAGFGGVGLVLLATTVFSGEMTWSTGYEAPLAPLREPGVYAWIGAFLLASVVSAAVSAFHEDGDTRSRLWLGIAGGCGLVAILIAQAQLQAGDLGYRGEPFAWGKPALMLVGGLAVLVALAATARKRAWAFAVPVVAVQLAAFILLHKGAMNGLTNPHSWWFIWPIVWNFAVLALAAVTLPHGKSIAGAAFFAELGVSFYAYMPIVSDLRNPPMNWGYPRTWEGFKHAIMRGQYEAITMPNLLSKDGFSLFCQQMGFYFSDLRMQFTLVAATLALVPFTLWKGVSKGKSFKAVRLAAPVYVVVAALVVVFSELCEGLNDGEVPFRLDKYLLVLLALLALTGLGAMLVRQAAVVWGMIRRKPVDESRNDDVPFALRFSADDVSQQWLIASGACFAIMSFFLVALAGVKGDVQDGFIQKVKFISSHGIFSIWIGYGLVAGLAVAYALVRRFVKNAAARKTALVALCAAAALTAGIPVYENYTNDRLVFEMGSAEQNGHTFGWQFGNYQLRGAEAIREELSPDEEPLPDPLYPPEMEPHAVFFGGTDPGRFVPTYMIYSAHVRPDVYLITQNALADDTYMSVERDLYGDEIWIPSKNDSAESFNVYVREVNEGKRPKNANLLIANGRVQVTGALGVMEINAILTKMMFDHEKLRRAFYVEESYAIQWMYPYLVPNGLIMQIAPETGSLDAKRVRQDMEFWDWYTRRLLRDPAFRRDFPAQKSFSKLRTAIAGLYSRTGRQTEAARAFREAVAIYPPSPEASFRYIQESLLPRSKFDATLDILDYTDRVDPRNARSGQMRGYVTNIQQVMADISRFSQAKNLSPEDTLTYARALTAVGQNNAAAGQIMTLLAKPESDRFDILYGAASLLSQAGRTREAGAAMKRARTKAPANIDTNFSREAADMLLKANLLDDANAAADELVKRAPSIDAYLLQMRVKHARHDARGVQAAVYYAYQIDPNALMQRFQADEALWKIAEPCFQKKK